jgi:hypothetical protein
MMRRLSVTCEYGIRAWVYASAQPSPNKLQPDSYCSVAGALPQCIASSCKGSTCSTMPETVHSERLSIASNHPNRSGAEPADVQTYQCIKQHVLVK